MGIQEKRPDPHNRCRRLDGGGIRWLIGAMFKVHSRPLTLLVLLLSLASLSVVEARPYSLWGGQAEFARPKGAVIKGQPDNEYLITSKKNRGAVAVLIYRSDLTEKESRMSTRQLGRLVRANWKDSGAKVSNFKVKGNKVSMTLTGTVTRKDPVPLNIPRGKRVKVRAQYVGFRSGTSQTVEALVMSKESDWTSRSVRPYRKIVNSLKVRR